MLGVIDDAVEIRSEEDVYGPWRDASRVGPTSSGWTRPLIATKVALQYLGTLAEFTGRGARVLGVAEGGGSVGKLRVGDVITSGRRTRRRAAPSDIQAGLAGRCPATPSRSPPAGGSGATSRRWSESITLGSAHRGRRQPTPPDRPDPTTSSTVGSDGAAASPAGGDPGVRPVLGISVEPDAPRSTPPVRVDRLRDVTGPSAGLAWALAVVDRMTPSR